MKQISLGLLIILFAVIIVHCISWIIFWSSPKEKQLEYYTKRWDEYLERKEKAKRVTKRIINTVTGIKVILSIYISDELLDAILAFMGFFIIFTLKELRLKNIIEKPVNFIYLRHYNPESIKANIDRLEREIAVKLIVWE